MTLIPTWEGGGRGTLVHDWVIDIEGGDELVFRISADGDASCDSTAFYASYTIDHF